jgi:hypothetical protein
MAREVWSKPERMIARIASPMGDLVQIRPIDPEFWSQSGNIEYFKYFREHDAYLKKLRDDNGVLYHYTTLDALHGIVKEGAIWASDVRHLNDRAELHYALEHMRLLALKQWGAKNNQQPLNAIFRPGLTGQYATCLSRSRDQLSQWRSYGRRIGVAISFDRERLIHAAESQNGALVDCQYFQSENFPEIQSDLQPILDALRKPGASNSNGELIDMALQGELTDRVIQIATSIKHPSFREEQEVRLVFSVKSVSEAIQFRSSSQSLTPYIKVDIDGRRIGALTRRKFANHLGMLEVLVWPQDVDEQILDAIDMVLHSVGHVLISRSDSPYRT